MIRDFYAKQQLTEAKERSSYLDRISLSHSNCHINFKFRFEFENSASMWNVVVCRELLETRHKWGEQVEIVALFVLFVLPCFFSKYIFFKLQENELSSANTKTLLVGFARRELSFEWSHL